MTGLEPATSVLPNRLLPLNYTSDGAGEAFAAPTIKLPQVTNLPSELLAKRPESAPLLIVKTYYPHGGPGGSRTLVHKDIRLLSTRLFGLSPTT